MFAAASLTGAFSEIGEAFQAAHPGTQIRFNFAGSTALATQITQGAPADVFAAADPLAMDRAVAAGAIDTESAIFATNTAAIVVAADNPHGITGLADLADPALIVILCSPRAACGRYAPEMLTAAGVTLTPRSLEDTPGAVVTKVALGEADAGIVFATDVRAAGNRVSGITIPDGPGVRAAYPVAVTHDAPNPAGAAAFVTFLTTPAAQQILATYGFGAP